MKDLPPSRYQWCHVLPLEGKVPGPGSERDPATAPAGGREWTAEEDRDAAGAGPRRAEDGAVKKVVGPRTEREAVRVVREEAGLSEWRACGLIGMHRGSWRYQRRERNEGALRARLRELAAERPRFGYRRLYVRSLPAPASLFGWQSWCPLPKPTTLACTRPRRSAPESPVRSPPRRARSPARTPDSLLCGLAAAVPHARSVYASSAECSTRPPDTAHLPRHVFRLPPRLQLLQRANHLRLGVPAFVAQRGMPQGIRCDNGAELTSRYFLAWCIERKIDLVHLQPGAPMQNGQVESFHGKLRDECLRVNWFGNLFEARRKIAA
jgi:putative transposase